MLAKLVQERLKAKGWKASTLVRKSGLSQSAISKILLKRLMNLTTDTIDKLATALDLAPEELFRAALGDVRARQAPDKLDS